MWAPSGTFLVIQDDRVGQAQIWQTPRNFTSKTCQQWTTFIFNRERGGPSIWWPGYFTNKTCQQWTTFNWGKVNFFMARILISWPVHWNLFCHFFIIKKSPLLYFFSLVKKWTHADMFTGVFTWTTSSLTSSDYFWLIQAIYIKCHKKISTGQEYKNIYSHPSTQRLMLGTSLPCVQAFLFSAYAEVRFHIDGYLMTLFLFLVV